MSPFPWRALVFAATHTCQGAANGAGDGRRWRDLQIHTNLTITKYQVSAIPLDPRGRYRPLAGCGHAFRRFPQSDRWPGPRQTLARHPPQWRSANHAPMLTCTSAHGGAQDVPGPICRADDNRTGRTRARHPARVERPRAKAAADCRVRFRRGAQAGAGACPHGELDSGGRVGTRPRRSRAAAASDRVIGCWRV
jgi:hypothetical protein